ncbi:hypothetical protein PoB_000429200 [Plakobranchus ocellatus]|uniref:Uncharacterized protein n=1 Tax=Plakobranchus ocellatus TaxID=259542 RepID=A0AAV3Y5P9_9GAST|nr:hypothetical protein PoB_000429200 [Plakobranchus ocellatus]
MSDTKEENRISSDSAKEFSTKSFQDTTRADIPLCTDCTLLRCKTSCPASTCAACTFSPKSCSLSMLFDSGTACRPSPSCLPKCPSPLKCISEYPICPSSPICKEKSPPRTCLTSSPPCKPINRPCSCTPTYPPCMPVCMSSSFCSPKIITSATCLQSPGYSPKPSPCCPKPSPCCSPVKCILPPRCYRCCEVVYSSKQTSEAPCPAPCPSSCCQQQCPSPTYLPPCPAVCSVPCPAPYPCSPPQCSPCCSLVSCPPPVYSQRSKRFQEFYSGPCTWEAYGIRIKWTDPAAPGTCTVLLDHPVLLKLCVEVKPSSGLTPDMLSANCWTHMKTLCSPCGTWKDIPLRFQNDASSVGEFGISRYVYSVCLTPTECATVKLSFNVSWNNFLIWANGASETGSC